jgi:hypothetical protein
VADSPATNVAAAGLTLRRLAGPMTRSARTSATSTFLWNLASGGLSFVVFHGSLPFFPALRIRKKVSELSPQPGQRQLNSVGLARQVGACRPGSLTGSLLKKNGQQQCWPFLAILSLVIGMLG